MLTESVGVSDIHIYVYVMCELAIHSFQCQKTHNITLTIDLNTRCLVQLQCEPTTIHCTYVHVCVHSVNTMVSNSL